MAENATVIKNITKQISWNNKKNKELRAMRKTAQQALYNYMKVTGKDMIDDITIEKVMPKEKNQSKTKQEKKQEGIMVLRQNGIVDAEKVWEKLWNS